MSVVTVDKTVLLAFLKQGHWEEGAKENLQLREQLDFSFIKDIIADHKNDPDDPTSQAHLGLLVLACGVAHWGVHGAPADLIDPEKDQWKGPPAGRGKHLMGVTAGGVGLPHMDRTYLGRFLEKFAPAVDPAGHYKTITNTIQRLKNGVAFAVFEAQNQTSEGGEIWRDFTMVAETALGSFAAQEWVINRWLNRYWMPSVTAVRQDKRDITEAIVNARIRNSSSATADCALQRSRGAADPIEVQLTSYVSGCPGSKKDHKRRWGYMRRPVVLYTYVK
ncbi:hypothetical protein [Methylobacterium nonmethylotrophicum]|uniref:Uncharacterized protein n=1 Tax=Methylobacterium nonmethylotrophicum TaxID=1141884 RepID=A0A4Z0NXT1_9HYPH|nr:hypothetical protein [Methylobacterium nonmethylotrophicum]TGE01725.1 hypothetical protein EU555_03360 [Methylobacterium nonmethylotrophicum]